jgi:hypothetical protein
MIPRSSRPRSYFLGLIRESLRLRRSTLSGQIPRHLGNAKVSPYLDISDKNVRTMIGFIIRECVWFLISLQAPASVGPIAIVISPGHEYVLSTIPIQEICPHGSE